MLGPGNSPDEPERLAFIRSLNLLDTPSDPEIDKVIAKLSSLYDVPIALFTVVDADRQWFKSSTGLEVTETPRRVSFCGHAILQEDVFYVSDTLSDIRFADNPLVTGKPYIRFYAGAPVSVNGHKIGTLCIIDIEPRSFSTSELRNLTVEAEQLADYISRAYPK